MVKRKIVWSHRARIKLYEILKFYYDRNQSNSYSNKLYKRFTKELKLLKKHPDLGINTEIENVRGLKEVFNEQEFERLAGARKEVIVTISDHISAIKRLVNDMVEERKKSNVIDDNFKKAIAYEKNVKPYLDEIREHIDKLELIVDNEMWPLPKYRELLFTR